MAKLQKREINTIVIGALAITFMLGYTFGQKPYRIYKQSISDVAQAETALQMAQLTRDAVLEARRGQEELQARAKARPAGYDLYQFIAGAVKQAELEDRSDIQSQANPARDAQYSSVRLTIKGAKLEELVNLLYNIHSGDPLIILENVTKMQPEREGKGIECQMTFISPKQRAA